MHQDSLSRTYSTGWPHVGLCLNFLAVFPFLRWELLDLLDRQVDRQDS